MQPVCIFGQALVDCLAKSKYTLDDQKRMLDLGANRRFSFFDPPHDNSRKIFLIVDNLKAHYSHLVKQWLDKEGNRQRIELFHLQSYSPELNPDERLNADLKGQVRTGLVDQNRDQIKTKVRSAMKIIQRRPERVRKYFQDPIIAYAA